MRKAEAPQHTSRQYTCVNFMLRHKECMTSREKVPSGVAVRGEGGEGGEGEGGVDGEGSEGGEDGEDGEGGIGGEALL